MTSKEIFEEFKETMKMPEAKICDYRLCVKPYAPIDIPNAIHVQMKDGSTCIYVSRQNHSL